MCLEPNASTGLINNADFKLDDDGDDAADDDDGGDGDGVSVGDGDCDCDDPLLLLIVFDFDTILLHFDLRSCESVDIADFCIINFGAICRQFNRFDELFGDDDDDDDDDGDVDDDNDDMFDAISDEHFEFGLLLTAIV